jgi:K+-sensing histidine kinase KdpD
MSLWHSAYYIKRREKFTELVTGRNWEQAVCSRKSCHIPLELVAQNYGISQEIITNERTDKEKYQKQRIKEVTDPEKINIF